MTEIICLEYSLQNWLDLQSIDVSLEYFGSSGKAKSLGVAADRDLSLSTSKKYITKICSILDKCTYSPLNRRLQRFVFRGKVPTFRCWFFVMGRWICIGISLLLCALDFSYVTHRQQHVSLDCSLQQGISFVWACDTVFLSLQAASFHRDWQCGFWPQKAGEKFVRPESLGWCNLRKLWFLDVDYSHAPFWQKLVKQSVFQASTFLPFIAAKRPFLVLPCEAVFGLSFDCCLQLGFFLVWSCAALLCFLAGGVLPMRPAVWVLTSASFWGVRPGRILWILDAGYTGAFVMDGQCCIELAFPSVCFQNFRWTFIFLVGFPSAIF